MKKTILLFCAFFSFSIMFAQQKISGTIKDSNNEPLPGANILEKGTSNGASSDFNGNFSLTVQEGATLVISFAGFETKEINVANKSVFNITLSDGLQLDEVVIVGSRNAKRTAVDTPVPVDIIDVQDLATKNGKVEVNDILQYAAPSFNATKQSGSDGADHVVPASWGGERYTRYNLSWRDERTSAINPDLKIQALYLANIIVGWRSSDGIWDASFFVKNVIDDVDLTNIQGYYSDYSILGGDGLSSKFYAGNANMGRQIGAQIVYNF